LKFIQSLTLMQRGYLNRAPDAHDRRRLHLCLGERGQEAASIALSARRIDRNLSARLGEDCIKEAERALATAAPELQDLADQGSAA
jgi:DNA-binding MarR family transcriptional regulator